MEPVRDRPRRRRASSGRALGEEDRGLIFWVLSSLMVAEERITTKFSGLVGAYGSEEEATFLATQQVDEARHMQFYARFQDEVVADPAAIAAHVERAREQISPAFRAIFDVALVEAHERLVANPADAEAKVRFVTLYHLILEGTLGLTSFNFVTGYLEREGLLPGFVAGYSKIHHDEQRHIGYGIWYLREAVSDDPALADVVRATLRELLPAVAESLTPPEREGTDWRRPRRQRRGDPRLRPRRPDPPARRDRRAALDPLTRLYEKNRHRARRPCAGWVEELGAPARPSLARAKLRRSWPLSSRPSAAARSRAPRRISGPW